MNINLKRSDAELRDLFFRLRTRQDISNLLEIEDSVLIYFLYINNPFNYSEFELRKKSGESRTIRIPVTSLKILQRKLLRILSIVYEPRPSVNGFVRNRGILSNAYFHTKKKLILNLDLKDFFPSINFGRVRGMFMANPYALPPEIATVLAQICCYDNQLPQGAPTSPIISNMLCSKLDGELQKVAKNYRCTYSRYADDITFSSSRSTLPDNLVLVEKDEGGRSRYKTGPLLEDVISKNGFTVNPMKVRLFSAYVRQDVTGLVVNQKPNIRRGYIKNVRVILRAWEKYGLKDATLAFVKNNKRQRRIKTEPNLRQVIHGKINYIKHIRGERDTVYRKLQNRFLLLTQKNPQLLSTTVEEQIFARLWVIQSGGHVGTGFMLDGYGLVTCAHTLETKENIKVWRYNDPLIKIPADVLLMDTNKTDLAILRVSGLSDKTEAFKIGDSSTVAIKDTLTAYGFSSYRQFDEPINLETKVRGFRPANKYGTRIIIFDKPVFSGESGSPLLNKRNEVIGVIATGFPVYLNQENVGIELELSAIPISAIGLLKSAESTLTKTPPKVALSDLQ